MAGAKAFLAQEPSAAASGTSDHAVSTDGLVTGPVAQIIITSAATVNVQHSFDNVNYITILTITSSDSIELDPRGVYYRFTWTGNNGLVSVLVGPGYAQNMNGVGLSNVGPPTIKSQTPA